MSATEDYTARDVTKNVVFEAMEGIVRGQDQAKAVWNPSPECDSIVEHLARVQDAVPPNEMAEILRLLRELLESNAAETEHERRVAGFADQMARWMRSRECNGHREPRA